MVGGQEPGLPGLLRDRESGGYSVVVGGLASGLGCRVVSRRILVWHGRRDVRGGVW